MAYSCFSLTQGAKILARTRRNGEKSTTCTEFRFSIFALLRFILSRYYVPLFNAYQYGGFEFTRAFLFFGAQYKSPHFSSTVRILAHGSLPTAAYSGSMCPGHPINGRLRPWLLHSKRISSGSQPTVEGIIFRASRYMLGIEIVF